MSTAFVWAPTSLLFLLGDPWQALTLLISLSVPLWVHSFKLRRKKQNKKSIYRPKYLVATTWDGYKYLRWECGDRCPGTNKYSNSAPDSAFTSPYRHSCVPLPYIFFFHFLSFLIFSKLGTIPQKIEVFPHLGWLPLGLPWWLRW